jgi:acyl carrier protein
MTRDDVLDRLRAFLDPRLGGHTVAEHDDIFALGYVNSLFAMQLVVFMESEFAVRLGPQDMDFDNFRTIDSLVRLITAKTAAPA